MQDQERTKEVLLSYNPSIESEEEGKTFQMGEMTKQIHRGRNDQETVVTVEQSCLE